MGVQNYLRHAAALVLAVAIALLFSLSKDIQGLGKVQPVHYANNGLKSQRIELQDGSVVHLDVGAKMSVRISQKERALELEKGRALFDVAHDKRRPFSVEANGTRIVALGTQFQVEVEARRQTVDVTLEQGSVAVSDTTRSQSWREVLSPGHALHVDRNSNQRKTRRVDASAATSWSTGLLVFEGMPLQQVLDELNRYASVKVRLGDSDLADVPIGGNFAAGGDSMEFVETLEAVLPLRSVRTGANEIVLFQKLDRYGS